MKKIIPRGSWVLVKPADKESHETDQGLILPENEEKEQKARGIVVSTGSDVSGLAKGNEIIYGAYAGENIKMKEDGKEVEYKILLDEDIIAFLE